MKKFTTAILVTAAALSTVSCRKEVIGEGPVITNSVKYIQPFTAIDLQMNGNVYYTNDPVRKIEVIAKESIHGMLETYVTDNRLVIRYRNGKTYDQDETIRINVCGPDVNSFSLNTSGSIFLNNEVFPTNLFLRSHGSGSIMLKNIKTNNIDAESTVSGRIASTGGSAVTVRTKTNGSAKIDLSAVSARNVTAEIIGSGDISINASESLDATIKGSGSVYFTGYPFISTHISGTGRMIRL